MAFRGILHITHRKANSPVTQLITSPKLLAWLLSFAVELTRSLIAKRVLAKGSLAQYPLTVALNAMPSKSSLQINKERHKSKNHTINEEQREGWKSNKQTNLYGRKPLRWFFFSTVAGLAGETRYVVPELCFDRVFKSLL